MRKCEKIDEWDPRELLHELNIAASQPYDFVQSGSLEGRHWQQEYSSQPPNLASGNCDPIAYGRIHPVKSLVLCVPLNQIHLLRIFSRTFESASAVDMLAYTEELPSTMRMSLATLMLLLKML